MDSRAVPGEGRVIKLSDVKVRLQYRWRVRQRLMVIHFARLHGPTAAGRRFGVSVRTIRRWRVRWRGGAVQGLVPTDTRPPGRPAAGGWGGVRARCRVSSRGIHGTAAGG